MDTCGICGGHLLRPVYGLAVPWFPEGEPPDPDVWRGVVQGCMPMMGTGGEFIAGVCPPCDRAFSPEGEIVWPEVEMRPRELVHGRAMSPEQLVGAYSQPGMPRSEARENLENLAWRARWTDDTELMEAVARRRNELDLRSPTDDEVES